MISFVQLTIIVHIYTVHAFFKFVKTQKKTNGILQNKHHLQSRLALKMQKMRAQKGTVV